MPLRCFGFKDDVREKVVANLYEMKLFDQMEIGSVIIVRVVGGWIHNDPTFKTSTFVPFVKKEDA
jgi:hypothetical protein